MFDIDQGLKRSIQEDADGRLIFYPYGALGKGRVLPDRARAEANLSAQKGFMWLSVGGGVTLAGSYKAIGLGWIAAIIGFLCAVMWLWMYALCRGLPLAD